MMVIDQELGHLILHHLSCLCLGWSCYFFPSILLVSCEGACLTNLWIFLAFSRVRFLDELMKDFMVGAR